MSTFEYTAINADNAIFRGQLSSWTKRQANKHLRQRQLTVVTLQKIRRGGNWSGLWRHISTVDRIVFTRSLLTMIKAGMNISDALASSREQSGNVALQKIITAVEQRIQAGHTLASCLASYPAVFSNEYVAMINMGERSGKLIQVLAFLTAKMENDYRIIRKIRNAMVYPALILVFMVAMITLMMVFVIPRVAAVYADAHVPLPIYTRILVTISHFVAHDIAWLAGGVFLLVLLYDLVMQRSLRFRLTIHRFVLRLPLFGLMIKKVNLAIISRSLAMLLHSGLTIDEALRLTAKTSRNTVYRQAIDAAGPFVARGVRLTDVVSGSPHLFLPVFRRMVATGEQSGNLDTMFDNVAQYYSDDIDHWSTNFSAVIEPFLISAVGVVVAGLAVAILFPLWNFVNVIS